MMYIEGMYGFLVTFRIPIVWRETIISAEDTDEGELRYTVFFLERSISSYIMPLNWFSIVIV